MISPFTYSMTVVRQTKRIPWQCKICEAPARYSYYGTIVCQSCKMFFKRNAQVRQTVLQCHFGNKCDINLNNRHVCSSCRFAKCFANGMCTEMIRSYQSKKNKRSQQRKLIIRSIPVKSIASVTLDKSDQLEHIPTLSLLQSDQSTLSIDQWNLLSNVKCKVQHVFEKNRDFLSLSPHDRTTLLRTTLEHTTSLSGMFTLHQHRLFDYPSFYNVAEMIFRPAAADFTKRAIEQLDPDNTFIKLILAILAFSTISYTVYTKFSSANPTNIKAILPIQDMYIELTWRYLLYKYNHREAVIRFSNLIRCLFFVNDAIVEAHKSQQFTKMIDSVIEQTLSI